MPNEDLSQLKIDKTAEIYQPQRKRKAVYWTIGIVIAVLVIVLFAAGVFTPAVEVEPANVTQIYPSQTFTLLNASGYVVAQRKAAVASKVTARLISLAVEEGNRVKKGEIIARLENEDVRAALNQAEANLNAARYGLEQSRAELNDARVQFERNRSLIDKGYVSQAEFDSSEARYRKAVAAVAAAEAGVKAGSASLQSARVALEYTMIRAPFDAVVLTKNADIGDIVTPIGAAADAKAAVVTIADMESLLVEVDVSESNLHMVRTGQPCEIQLDALPDARFRGEVHMIVPTADRTKATILVKVRFVDKDSRVLPEMSAKVAFLSREITDDEREPLTALSKAAVVKRKGGDVVFLIREHRASETVITTGREMHDMIEILGGIKAGDRVVLKPLEKMKNGLRIKVAEH
ncbi:MAG: efflux RND transporter periplasmic adaptor subunit [Nitrospirota bacterium]